MTGRENYYEPTDLLKFSVVSHKKGDTIQFVNSGSKTRLICDTTKWRLTEQLADSGSTLSILLTPKEKKGSATTTEVKE